MAIPFLLFGDGPRLRSGLARIARDLAMRLKAEEDPLGIRLLQVGVDYPHGWHWQPWDFYGFQPSSEDQGWLPLKQIEQELQHEGSPKPVVLAIMDPARVFDLVRAHEEYPPEQRRLEMDVWGYFPIDGHTPQDRIGGPAAEAVADVQRVLAYGAYGGHVLRRTLETILGERHPDTPTDALIPGGIRVSYLPHGLEPGAFAPTALAQAHPEFQAWARTHTRETLKVGCVATNQARKDLGLLFTSVAELKLRGFDVAVWLHTDLLTKAWDIGELVMASGLERHEVAVSTAELTDAQLSAQYSWSDVTLAPGLGEGFGYPIVESLACGTPVVHGEYAGGVELVPRADWLVKPAAWRLDGVYAILRPVYRPADVAQALETAATSKQGARAEVQAYCRGSVAHLSWEYLWPRWRAWIVAGLARRQPEPDPEVRQAVEALEAWTPPEEVV